MIEERRDKTSRTRVQVTCSSHAPRANQELSNSIKLTLCCFVRDHVTFPWETLSCWANGESCFLLSLNVFFSLPLNPSHSGLLLENILSFHFRLLSLYWVLLVFRSSNGKIKASRGFLTKENRWWQTTIGVKQSSSFHWCSIPYLVQIKVKLNHKLDCQSEYTN